MRKALRIAEIGRECVACGCCTLVCPKAAISIRSGTLARVNEASCAGCGKCVQSCPAGVITITERKEAI